MSEVINPYAPPAAAVSDVHAPVGVAGYQKVKLFSSQGRIGRLRFLTYMSAVGLVFGLVQMVLAFVATLLAVATETTWVAFIPFLVLIPYFVFLVLLQIQRSHDMDWTGWSSLLIYVPIVGLIWFFKGGTKGVNRFGAPPPPNSLSVKIVGLGLPILTLMLVVLGLLFGGFSAYEAYVERAISTPAE